MNNQGSQVTETVVQDLMASRPATIRRIAKFLFNRYGDVVDIRDLATKPANEQADNLLTRSLAAHAVSAYSEATPTEAARCVVDGGQDLGIDAIAFSESEKRCWLVQSKFVKGGTGLIDKASILKFLEGFGRIVSCNLEGANPKILAMRDELESAATGVSWKFTVVLASTSNEAVSDEIVAKIHEDLQYQDPGNMGTFTFENFDLNAVTRSVEESLEPASIDLDIELSEWGCVIEPVTSYYGHVPLSSLLDWRQHGVALFDKNLRGFDSSSHVASSIEETLARSSQYFWYLNNGATLLCQTIARAGPYSNTQSRAVGRFHCKGVSVVNGAQTIGTLWAKAGNGESLEPTARVHVRLISLAEEGEEFGKRVTKATNTQKNILARDFATLDAAQKALQKQFSLDGLVYVFRTGVTPPKEDEGCTLEQVVLALACEKSVEYAIVAHRNPGYLTDPDHWNYKAIFHGNEPLKSEDVWRAVRIYRVSVTAIASVRRKLTGRPNQGVTHGARYIVHRVFEDPRVKAIRGVWDENAVATVRSVAVEQADLVAKQMEYEHGYLQVLFKNTERVKNLHARLNATQKAASDEQALPRTQDHRDPRLFD